MVAKKKSKKKKSLAMPSTDREWEIKNAADTLIRANEITADKTMMRGVNAELKRRVVATKKAIRTK